MKSFTVMFHFYFLLASMVVAIPTPVEIPCGYCPLEFHKAADWIRHLEGEPIGYLKYTS
jgi:hypothetical protein